MPRPSAATTTPPVLPIPPGPPVPALRAAALFVLPVPVPRTTALPLPHAGSPLQHYRCPPANTDWVLVLVTW